MLREQGLPRRPREAIEQRNWPEADQQINCVAETITQIAAAIDRATAQVK